MLWETEVARRDERTLGAMVLDEFLRIACVSEGLLHNGGLVRSALVGADPVSFVHPDDMARAADALAESQAAPGPGIPGLYRLRLGDGHYDYFSIRAIRLDDQSNGLLLEVDTPSDVIRAQAFADDAVDAMRMLSEDITLEESFDWIARVAERHVRGLQIVTTLFSDTDVNRILSRTEIPSAIRQVNEKATRQVLPIHVEMAMNDFTRRRWRSSKRIASLDHIVPGRLTSILADRTGEIVGYVEALRSDPDVPSDAEWIVHGMISRMLTAALHRHEFDRHLRQAADLDPLTGLTNRRKLFDVLGTHPNLAGSLVYLIDLDRFSWVNNNLGHQAGDETLRAVSRALIQVCPPTALIARLGGDEFVVWVPADQAVDDLADLGNRISKSMVVPAGIGDGRVWVRASIGMVQIRPGESAADALNRADVAMYASKRGGGDCATLG